MFCLRVYRCKTSAVSLVVNVDFFVFLDFPIDDTFMDTHTFSSFGHIPTADVNHVFDVGLFEFGKSIGIVFALCDGKASFCSGGGKKGCFMG